MTLWAHPGLLEPFLNIRDETDIKSFPNIGTEAAVRRLGQYGNWEVLDWAGIETEKF